MLSPIFQFEKKLFKKKSNFNKWGKLDYFLLWATDFPTLCGPHVAQGDSTQEHPHSWPWPWAQTLGPAAIP